MNNIRTLIADDDMGMRLIMKKFVERAGGFELVGEASDGEELIRKNALLSPDVIILDVEMPVMTGVECAKIIQDVNPKTILVFATAHEKYMKEAFEVYAFDYLVKPFKLERAMTTLEMIRKRFFSEKPEETRAVKKTLFAGGKLMLRHREGITFADTKDIILIQREDRATVIELSGGERLVTSESLSELEQRLPEGMFFRTHKSYIVGLEHIQSIAPYGRWTYTVNLRGTQRDALITSERLEALEQLFQ